MFESSIAIILHCQKHSDRAEILHTYTRRWGRMNLMVYGGHKKGNLRGLIETPLTIAEICFDNKPNREMQTLHSLVPVFIPKQQDPTQQLARVFMSEVIYKTLRQPMADERVFQFLEESIRQQSGEPPQAISGEPPQAINRQEFKAEEWMMNLSSLLGYGGEWLDEWKELKSLEMIREVLF